MAEAKSAPTAVPVVPTPESATVVPAQSPKENAWIKAASRVLTTTILLAAGFAFLIFGVFFRMQQLNLGPFSQFASDHNLRIHYILIGFGLLLLGQARMQVFRLYSEEARKTKTSVHAWKVPLVIAQVVLLQLAGIYGLLVGFNIAIKEPIHNLLFFFAIGMILLMYLFWYLIAHFQNRYQRLAGLHVAGSSLILASVSLFSWTLGQFVILSLIAGFFSMLALLIALVLAPLSKDEQRGNWLRSLCLMGSILFLIPIGLAANPFNKPMVSLVQLGPAVQNLYGQIDQMVYTPDSKKIAFTQKNEDGWYLGIINPEAIDNKIVKYQAGDGLFTPTFVDQGSSAILDIQKGSSRNLYLLNLSKGKLKPLTHIGIEAISGGIPWSESKHQFLYVFKTSKGYQLNMISLPSGKSKKVFTSAKPILSPSWVGTGYEIAYVDGVCERPYIYDQELKTSKALFSDDERAQIAASGGKLKIGFPSVEVIPSPDASRYLFKTQKNDITVLQTAMADGSKANELYRSFLPIEHLSWLDFGQKIIFDEKGRQAMYLLPSKKIEVEDANQGFIQTLIWPQISHHSPAPSPDGVKVAFVGSSGLWYPSIGLSESSGIWVAVLR